MSQLNLPTLDTSVTKALDFFVKNRPNKLDLKKFPPSFVVGSGNAVRRSALIQACVPEVLGLPLELPAGCEETAVGAALLAARLGGSS